MFLNPLSLLALTLWTHNITGLSESAWNMVLAPVISSRLRLWIIHIALCRVFSGALSDYHKNEIQI